MRMHLIFAKNINKNTPIVATITAYRCLYNVLSSGHVNL